MISVASLVLVATAGSRVLVIFNDQDAGSRLIARTYAEARHIPDSQMLGVGTSLDDAMTEREFDDQLAMPVKAAVGKVTGIDFLVICRGVPLRIRESGNSVDGQLMTVEGKLQPVSVNQNRSSLIPNPYFNKREAFTHAKFGFFLATRLDGHSPNDAIALIERAKKARRVKGPFLFDGAENRRTATYGALQAGMAKGAAALSARGFTAKYDDTPTFVDLKRPLAGYLSWGSNDGKFDLATYGRLRFLPGAIAETYVSTSGRTFHPTSGGQSLISDLIEQGVTGVKGYVSEPYTLAMAKADVLFDRYTRGFNLAESFYMASPVIRWKDVVIGDPLCAPYAK